MPPRGARARLSCASCGAGRRAAGASDREDLPLCDSCWGAVEAAAAGGAHFYPSYAAPRWALRSAGLPLLEAVTLGAARGAPTAAARSAAIDALACDAPLLVLLGAGCSVAYGVEPGYGPGEDADPAAGARGVCERYWPVFEQASRAGASSPGRQRARFYARLGEAVRARGRRRTCVATTNVDGLAAREVPGVLELHGSVLRAQCSRRGGPCVGVHRTRALDDSLSAADGCDIGRCGSCDAPLRFHVCTFDDVPGDIDLQAAHDAIMRFVGGCLRGGVRRQPALRVLVVGCSDHTHSLVHEARAVAAERVLAGLDTKVVVVNPSSEGAALLGDGAEQVSCTAEDLFLSR